MVAAMKTYQRPVLAIKVLDFGAASLLLSQREGNIRKI